MQFSDTVSDLLVHNRIPTLDAGQMSDLSRYLFTASNKTERIQVAEAVYRHDHDHPSALDVFLACTFPLAEKSALRRAHKIFIYPSDWQVELMYDGAATAAIAVFQRNSVVEPGSNAFRRYLYRALALGTVRSYFRREEYDGVCTVADFAKVPTRKMPLRNQAEQEIITRDLLKQVTGFPNLRPRVCATLQCIPALGPDEALKSTPTRNRAIRTNGSAKGEEGRFSTRMPLPRRWGQTGIRCIPICARQESHSEVPSMPTANCFSATEARKVSGIARQRSARIAKALSVSSGDTIFPSSDSGSKFEDGNWRPTKQRRAQEHRATHRDEANNFIGSVFAPARLPTLIRAPAPAGDHLWPARRS